MTYTILVADDDLELLKILKSELETQGYHVLIAADGQIAIHQAQTQRIDLVILDIAMPMMSGLQVFDRLRTHPQTQKTPVIFLTGLPSAEVYPTIAQGTHVAYCKKPLDLVELTSLMHQLLQDPSSR